MKTSAINFQGVMRKTVLATFVVFGMSGATFAQDKGEPDKEKGEPVKETVCGMLADSKEIFNDAADRHPTMETVRDIVNPQIEKIEKDIGCNEAGDKK